MINLIVNYYKDKNPARQIELDSCLLKNLKNDLVNVIIIKSQKRLNYDYYFNMFDKISSNNDINIISNLDIYMTESISYCKNMRDDDFFALSRWDLKPDGQIALFNREDSQDTWIFKGKPKKIKCEFPLGLRGCDNRLAHEAKAAGYKVSNPSKDIKTIHVHKTNARNYSMKGNADVVPPPYYTVKPCSLKDLCIEV